MRTLVFLIMILILFSIISTVLLFSGFRWQRISNTLKDKMWAITTSFSEKIERIEDDLTLIMKWGASGSINLNTSSAEDLNNRLIPLVESSDFIESVLLMQNREFYYKLEQSDNKWQGTYLQHVSINADKAIEQACLKAMVAFLNSAGGVLLVGVNDDGSILGLGKDHFRNNDKFLLHFDNMIKTHIGLEYISQIDFNILKHNGKDVLVVKCKPSVDPVFLKYEENEDFYIRVGPSSRKLSTRKAIKYINERIAKNG